MLLTVAIYNGLSVYHDLYSYILYWCKQNNFDCTIYSNDHSDDYKEKFPFLIYDNCPNFINNAHLYHIIFLIAAEDDTFDKSWSDLYGLHHKIVKFNHISADKHPEIKKSINIKNFNNDKEGVCQVLDKYVKDSRPNLFNQVSNNIIIPKNIYFMWLAKPDAKKGIPSKYTRNIKTFRKYNPGYTIKIWNLEDTTITIKTYLPEFWETFATISKCDFARFCLIYIFGGIYSDLDFYCSKQLDGLLNDKEYIFAIEPCEHGKDHLYNGFFASIPKNPFIYGWLKTMESHALLSQVMFKTGPIGLAYYYNGLTDKPQLTETYKVMLYYNKHKVINTVSDANNIDDNYVYTLWNEGTNWDTNNFAGFIYIGIIIVIMILIFILYLVTK